MEGIKKWFSLNKKINKTHRINDRFKIYNNPQHSLPHTTTKEKQRPFLMETDPEMAFQKNMTTTTTKKSLKQLTVRRRTPINT